MRQLAETIAGQCESVSDIVFGQLPVDDPKQRQPDISQARERLGWQPSVALADGLPPTIQYFRQFL